MAQGLRVIPTIRRSRPKTSGLAAQFRAATLRAPLPDATRKASVAYVAPPLGFADQGDIDPVDTARPAILHSRLVVWSQPLMGHPYRVIRRMRYGPDSAWERHNDRGGPSSDTA